MNRQAHLAFEVAARANKWKVREDPSDIPTTGLQSLCDHTILFITYPHNMISNKYHNYGSIYASRLRNPPPRSLED